MLEPIKPPEEVERLAEVFGLGLLDTPREERFDRITRTAQRLFDMPIALISLIDQGRQWFKSCHGLNVNETARGISFCGHAILSDRAFIVHDAAADPRFFDNPLVTGDAHIRFYAGMPLHSVNGFRLGTLCVIDHVPRSFSDADIATLRDMAAWAELELNVVSIRHATAEAKEREARLRAIVDHAGDGIITTDEHGLIETFNPAAARMFGYMPQQVIGEDVRKLMMEPHRHKVENYLQTFSGAAKQNQNSIDLGREVIGQREDGSSFPAELVVSETWWNGRRGFTGIVRDISERRRAEEQVRALNQQLAATTRLQQAILDSTNYSIMSTDMNGTIRMSNDGCARMLGYTADELVGQHSVTVLHVQEELAMRASQLSRELGRKIAPDHEVFTANAHIGVTDEREWTYVRKDGSRLPVMLSVSPLTDEQGEWSGFVSIASDLTERKKVEYMKNEFISTVSHELRTPLTSIRGSLGLLAAGTVGEPPPRAKVLLDIANKNCERLVRLINDFLDLEKIESGSMRFDIVKQPVLPLVEHAISATQDYAAQFQVKLALQPDAVNGLVAVDADRLTQVIVNLLSNAAKFSPPGGTVEVRVTRANGYARLSVTDYGDGIPEQFRSRIFQKFAQADSSDTRSKGGTGLGLSICKMIIEKHNGHIDFRSEQGAGTEFYVELPLAEPVDD